MQMYVRIYLMSEVTRLNPITQSLVRQEQCLWQDVMQMLMMYYFRGVSFNLAEQSNQFIHAVIHTIEEQNQREPFNLGKSGIHGPERLFGVHYIQYVRLSVLLL